MGNHYHWPWSDIRGCQMNRVSSLGLMSGVKKPDQHLYSVGKHLSQTRSPSCQLCTFVVGAAAAAAGVVAVVVVARVALLIAAAAANCMILLGTNYSKPNFDLECCAESVVRL